MLSFYESEYISPSPPPACAKAEKRLTVWNHVRFNAVNDIDFVFTVDLGVGRPASCAASMPPSSRAAPP
jgi:hypothetical protein